MIRNRDVMMSIVRVVMIRFFVVFLEMMVYCLKKMNMWLIGIILSGDFLIRFLWIVNMVFFWNVEFELFFMKVVMWEVIIWLLLDENFMFCLRKEYFGILRNDLSVGMKLGLVMFIVCVVENFVKMFIYDKVCFW